MLDAEAAAESPPPEPEEWDVPEEPAAEAPPPEPEPVAPELEPEPEPEPVAQEPEPESESEPESEPEAEPAPEPEPEPEDDQAEAAIAAMMGDHPAPTPGTDETPGDISEDEDLAPAPPVGATPRKPLDDGLLSILREEAEREAAQRRAEGTSELETQDELNLEEGEASADAEAAAAVAARDLARRRQKGLDFSDLSDPAEADRVADLLGTEAEDPRTMRGRERLPDIDEINSTLTATSDREGDSVAEFSPEMAKRRRSGFSAGFIFVMLLALVFAAIYIFAPQIAERVPALKPALTQYVIVVDEGRIWLDELLRGAITRLAPEASGAGPPQ